MNDQYQHIDYDLLAKHLSGETTAEEALKIEAWRNANAENEANWNEMQAMWSIASEEELDVDTDAAWAKMSSQIAEENDDHHQPIIDTTESISKLYYSWAAMFAMVFGLAGALWFLMKTDFNTFNVSGQMASVELMDGTIVTVHDASSLRYPEDFEDDIREVWLDGVAYFEVAKNESQPFVIHTELGNIKVVGTAFEVDSRSIEDVLTIEVEEGIVEVSDRRTKSTARVTAGQTCTVSAEAEKISVTEDLSPGAFFWKDKTIKFKRTQLGKVVETLNGLLELDITLSNEQLNNCELTATFIDENPQAILEIIAATLGLELESKGDKSYTLSGEGC